jgi:hypothetical protein
MYPRYLEKAKELGHILDYQVWIHLQGDEWNVVVTTVYPSWQKWANPESGWGEKVFAMIEPDSTRRAAYNAGATWVYRGTIHRDNIFRRATP